MGLVVGKKLLIPYLPGKEPVEIKPVVIGKVEGKGEALVVPLPKPTDAKGGEVKVAEKVDAPKDAKAGAKEGALFYCATQCLTNRKSLVI